MKLIRHGGLYILGTVAPILSTLIITPFITRLLGADQYGSVAISYSIAQLVAIGVALGLPAAITRAVVIDPQGKHVGGQLTIAGAITASLVASIILVISLGIGTANYVLVAGVGTGFALALVAIVQSYYRGLERPVSFVLIGGTLALGPPIIGLLSLFWVGNSALVYLTTMSLSQCLVGLVGIALIWRKTQSVASFKALRSALRIAVPTIPHQIAGSLVLSASVFAANWYGGGELAGKIQVAALLGTAPHILIGAINNAWAPMIYRAPQQERLPILGKSTVLITYIGMTFAFGYAVFARYLLAFIAGPVFSPDVVFLSVVIAASVLLQILYLSNVHLTFTSGKTWPLAIISPFSTLVAIVALFTILSVPSNLSIFVFGFTWVIYHLLQCLFGRAIARWSYGAAAPLSRSIVLVLLGISGTLLIGIPRDSFVQTFVLAGFAFLIGTGYTYLVSRKNTLQLPGDIERS